MYTHIKFLHADTHCLVSSRQSSHTFLQISWWVHPANTFTNNAQRLLGLRQNLLVTGEVCNFDAGKLSEYGVKWRILSKHPAMRTNLEMNYSDYNLKWFFFSYIISSFPASKLSKLLNVYIFHFVWEQHLDINDVKCILTFGNMPVHECPCWLLL